MSGFSRSPRLMKGALVSFDFPSPVPQVISFQYNSDSLSRSLQSFGSVSDGGGGDQEESSRLAGVPVETIDLDMEMDATDQLENPNTDQTASKMGLYPQLSALEMILYPKISNVVLNSALSRIGMVEIAPSQGPFTLFIWGIKRVLPVKLASLSIREEAHDTNLNPIRATVSISLRILSYRDFKFAHPGYGIFFAHHVTKETMAAIGSINNAANVASGNVRLF